MKDFSVKFALADSEYLTALRLVAGALCSASDVDVDALEDFKVCVTECANILKNCGYSSATFTFSRADGVSCSAAGEGGDPREGDNDLSLALISALVESCDISKIKGVTGRILIRI